ncbi:MAG: GNAT family N-acetyltransferase [Candidatus Edwardsbacteria bacterium]
MSTFQIQSLNQEWRDWANHLIENHWGSTRIVTRGRIHHAEILPGFVARQENKPVGLVTYRIEGEEYEIITLDSLLEGIGIGSALLDAVKKTAISAKCRRLWLITTNDNLNALRFYQKRGFSLVAVHRNALEQSRRLKPEIPLVGLNGILLRDEIELEMLL